MMSKKKNMLRNGILAGLATMFMAFGVGCGEDEPESRCDDGEAYLLIGDNEAQCYTQCSEDTDCTVEGEICRGSGEARVCREGGEEPDPDPDPNACDAQVVCESYCEAQFGGCIDEQCENAGDIGEGVTLRDAEIESCINGLTLQGPDGQPVEITAGCLAEAEASEAACEQFEADAEQLAADGCGGDAGKAFVCSELALYNSTLGADIYENQCGCEAAPVASECAADEDCNGSVYSGFCVTELQDETPVEGGFCIAQCDAAGLQAGGVRNDVNCGGEMGLCVNTAEAGGICEMGCLAVEDCPRTPADGVSCLPTLSAEIEGEVVFFGTCNIAECDPDAETPTCEEEGDVCHPFGFCTPSCEVTEEDPTGGCEDGSFCGEEGFCEFNWSDSF